MTRCLLVAGAAEGFDVLVHVIEVVIDLLHLGYSVIDVQLLRVSVKIYTGTFKILNCITK